VEAVIGKITPSKHRLPPSVTPFRSSHWYLPPSSVHPDVGATRREGTATADRTCCTIPNQTNMSDVTGAECIKYRALQRDNYVLPTNGYYGTTSRCRNVDPTWSFRHLLDSAATFDRNRRLFPLFMSSSELGNNYLFRLTMLPAVLGEVFNHLRLEPPSPIR